MINQPITICDVSTGDDRARDNTSVAAKSIPERAARHMTKLGEYLNSKSVNKAIVARKTGLSRQRMGEITLNEDAKLRANEVYLIGMAIGVNPNELFQYVCAGLKLRE